MDVRAICGVYLVKMTFVILAFCYTGARIGASVPDSSKADEGGLRWKVCELRLCPSRDASNSVVGH
jgi:hypothetical protein